MRRGMLEAKSEKISRRECSSLSDARQGNDTFAIGEQHLDKDKLIYCQRLARSSRIME